ncbi:MAG: hypothetical protein JRI81_02595 [Deltaproteobacteria bacterium]|nr:hypothetical protein [Deltaproteobacteria bacterium]
MGETKPLSLKGIKSYSIKDRRSKVGVKDFAKKWESGGDLKLWLESLPQILAAGDFRKVVQNVVKAVRGNKTVVLAMGAHPIKVGLNPIIIDLLERDAISSIAMNGAGIIHDTEIAMAGHTSEHVSAHLASGKFGMAEEPATFLNESIRYGAENGVGLGKAVGLRLAEQNFPYKHLSLLARAFELGKPVTVHVAIGTDTIHFHPSVDPGAVGKTSHLDFRIFAGMISKLNQGVFINMGSAVIMPEVFLKALTLVRNLGYEVKEFTTLNMDFIRNYRPLTNVVQRPTLEGGEGFSLVGHHEIMFPLLASAIIEDLEKDT